MTNKDPTHFSQKKQPYQVETSSLHESLICGFEFPTPHLAAKCSKTLRQMDRTSHHRRIQAIHETPTQKKHHERQLRMGTPRM